MYEQIVSLSRLFVKSAGADDKTKPPGKVSYEPDETRFETPQHIKDIAENKFNIETLNKITDYDMAFEYLKHTLNPVGSGRGDGIGSGRIAFDLGNNVLKWAHNNGGIAQNYMESRIQDRSPLLTNVYYAHPKSWWIISEKVNPFRDWNDFVTITGVPQELFDINSDQFAFRSSLSPQEINQLRIRYDLEPDAVDFITKLMMVRNSLQLAGDTFVPEHWGISPSGEVKLYDYGYDKSTFDAVYKGYKDPEPSKSELEALQEMEDEYGDDDEDGVYLFASSIIDKYIVTAEEGSDNNLNWVLALEKHLETGVRNACLSRQAKFSLSCKEIRVNVTNVEAPEANKPITIEIYGVTLLNNKANSRRLLDSFVVDIIRAWDAKNSQKIGESFVTKVY